jgi:hypothetical protein
MRRAVWVLVLVTMVIGVGTFVVISIIGSRGSSR